jgi:hypothetical protein
VDTIIETEESNSFVEYRFLVSYLGEEFYFIDLSFHSTDGEFILPHEVNWFKSRFGTCIAKLQSRLSLRKIEYEANEFINSNPFSSNKSIYTKENNQ